MEVSSSFAILPQFSVCNFAIFVFQLVYSMTLIFFSMLELMTPIVVVAITRSFSSIVNIATSAYE